MSEKLTTLPKDKVDLLLDSIVTKNTLPPEFEVVYKVCCVMGVIVEPDAIGEMFSDVCYKLARIAHAMGKPYNLDGKELAVKVRYYQSLVIQAAQAHEDELKAQQLPKKASANGGKKN